MRSVLPFCLICLLGVAAETDEVQTLRSELATKTKTKTKTRIAETDEVQTLRSELAALRADFKVLHAQVSDIQSEGLMTPLQRLDREPHRRLTDTSEYIGVNIKYDQAILSMGAEPDVKLLRTDVGELTIEADVRVSGGLHLDNPSLFTLHNMTVRQYIDQRIDARGPRTEPQNGVQPDYRTNKCICPNGYPLAGEDLCPTENSWGCEYCDEGYSEADQPWKDCYEAYTQLSNPQSGVYRVRLGGSPTGRMVEVYCDMGDYVGDTGGWTLVYKSGATYNEGLNGGELNIENLLDTDLGQSAKFSDEHINEWMVGERVLRYVAEASSSQQYLFYTQRKDFCNVNSPECSKDTCPDGSSDLYPLLDGAQATGSGTVWQQNSWANAGGIYEGHDNHGNCHGGMSTCRDGWDGAHGHICLWIDANTPGMWWNYGEFQGSRYPGTIWMRPAVEDGKIFNTYETALGDCYDVWIKDKNAPSGVYWIRKGGDGEPVRLYCDMGDLLGGVGGWTLVMKLGHSTFNEGLNTAEFNINRMTSKVNGADGKFSDVDINKWLGSGDRVIRYVAYYSPSELYTMYTADKGFCNDDSPNCPKSDCQNGLYRLKGRVSTPGSMGGNGEAWAQGWENQGGIYEGHDNHGNCHGQMSACLNGWLNSGAGHICTWIDANTPGMWMNYGPWQGNRYSASIWVRRTIADDAETGWGVQAQHTVCMSNDIDCQCQFGTPSWAGCSASDLDGCAYCDPGFELTPDDRCTGNTCVCTGGTPKRGNIQCPEDGVTAGCTACDGAYSIGPYADCYEAWLDLGPSAQSGTYWVRLGGSGSLVRVFCDMGDFYGDTGGWTLVYKTGSTFNGGLNANAFNTDGLLTPELGTGAKWADSDINSWMTGKRVIRYLATVDADMTYAVYTSRKDFCGDDSPACSKDTCTPGGDDLYPMMSAAEPVANRGDQWRSQDWVNLGGIYEGHDNHGNCHGGMSACHSGWNNAQGHVCLWIGSDNQDFWFNYGPFSGGYYPGTIWVRPAFDDNGRYNSENNPADDCYQIWQGDRSSKSGVYWVRKPSTGQPVRVYCDMGDKIGDIGGWTLVYRSAHDVSFDGGLSTNEYNLGAIHIDSGDVSTKFSDADINDFLNTQPGADRVLRYIGERDANELYVMYTMRKSFCSDHSDSCVKDDCPSGGQRYPLKSGIENRNDPQGDVWHNAGDTDVTGDGTNWYNTGGIYEGHNNHGNCHGAQSSCENGWIDGTNQGHLCLWIGTGEPGIWMNYGGWVGGRYAGTVWTRPNTGTPSLESGWDSAPAPGECLPH